MGVVGLERFRLRLFECENEVAAENVAVEFDLVLYGNGFGGVCLRECDHQFCEGKRCAETCAEFDFGRFCAFVVTEFGACVEQDAIP